MYQEEAIAKAADLIIFNLISEGAAPNDLWEPILKTHVQNVGALYDNHTQEYGRDNAQELLANIALEMAILTRIMGTLKQYTNEQRH